MVGARSLCLCSALCNGGFVDGLGERVAATRCVVDLVSLRGIDSVRRSGRFLCGHGASKCRGLLRLLIARESRGLRPIVELERPAKRGRLTVGLTGHDRTQQGFHLREVASLGRGHVDPSRRLHERRALHRCRGRVGAYGVRPGNIVNIGDGVHAFTIAGARSRAGPLR